ncbi:ABC transporter ATP-binding protein [Lachnospiraceae bacterium 54-53]
MKKIAAYYLKPYYLRMAMGFFIKFSGTLMDLFLPWTLAHMIDEVIPAGRKGEILLWGLFMLSCSVLAVTFSVIANRMASRVASDAIYTIRGDLFHKVMYLSDRQADGITRPSLISRLTSDTYNVHQMLTRVQRLGVRAPILLVGGIVMTLLLDPVLACVLLAALPLLAVVVVAVSKKSIPMFLELQESVDGFVRLVREDIAGIRVIKALSKEDCERQRFDDVNREVVDRERRAVVTTAVTNPAMNLFLNIGLVFVVLAGAYRVNRGLAEVGTILAFLTYFTIILNALMSISRMFIIISKAAASAERINQVLDGEDESAFFSACPREKREEEASYLEFDKISFSYNKSGCSLKDVSFRLKKGETLGIIGATGSGKSTIVNLLMRFYDADRGSIRIEGQDIRTMGLRDLRKRFGAVFQNDVIFEDTILENIQMGRRLSRKEAKEAAGCARALAFIEEKGGLDEKLDIKGANLSGGQKQRILIARALAGHPDILILDDSSSALDYKTDADLRRELREHFAETTCIVIAQRISSVMSADHILVLDEGSVIGYGSHEELMRDCEIYREIGESQMGT